VNDVNAIYARAQQIPSSTPDGWSVEESIRPIIARHTKGLKETLPMDGQGRYMFPEGTPKEYKDFYNEYMVLVKRLPGYELRKQQIEHEEREMQQQKVRLAQEKRDREALEKEKERVEQQRSEAERLAREQREMRALEQLKEHMQQRDLGSAKARLAQQNVNTEPSERQGKRAEKQNKGANRQEKVPAGAVAGAEPLSMHNTTTNLKITDILRIVKQAIKEENASLLDDIHTLTDEVRELKGLLTASRDLDQGGDPTALDVEMAKKRRISAASTNTKRQKVPVDSATEKPSYASTSRQVNEFEARTGRRSGRLGEGSAAGNLAQGVGMNMASAHSTPSLEYMSLDGAMGMMASDSQCGNPFDKLRQPTNMKQATSFAPRAFYFPIASSKIAPVSENGEMDGEKSNQFRAEPKKTSGLHQEVAVTPIIRALKTLSNQPHSNIASALNSSMAPLQSPEWEVWNGNSPNHPPSRAVLGHTVTKDKMVSSIPQKFDSR